MRREFIANAAHELRTPLTNLQGYLEALRDGVIAAGSRDVRVALEEAERLVRLSRSLDTLAEGDAGRRRAADRGRPGGARSGSAVDLARPAVRSGPASSSTSTCRTRCRPAATPTSSPRSLGNLLQNAVRYTPAGGRVTVRAERRPADVLVVGREHRRRHPGGRPAPRLRALLPGRQVA